MRPTRILLATVGSCALLGLGGCGVARASNTSGVWVQLSPGTISPGATVRITASCGDSSNSATVTSIAFGTVTLQPDAQTSLLTGHVTVSPHAAAGTFAVDLTCRTGSTATTTLTILGSNAVPSTATATMGPHSGGGYLATGGHGSRSAVAWIAGGLAAIGAAIGVTTVSQRRRRVPVRVRRR